MFILENIIEEVWLTKEKPKLTKKIFPDYADDFYTKLNPQSKLTDFAYAVYLKSCAGQYHKIIGWQGASKETPFIGKTNKFKKFIYSKIPSDRIKLAFHFDLFKHSFKAYKNTFSLFKKSDNKNLVTDYLFKETDGLIIWQHQFEELLQYAGFNKYEATNLRKGYQRGKQKFALEKLKKINLDSINLIDIIESRVPPMKSSKFNYATSEFFYQKYILPLLN